jgi:hypothetical protein
MHVASNLATPTLLSEPEGYDLVSAIPVGLELLNFYFLLLTLVDRDVVEFRRELSVWHRRGKSEHE